MKPNHFQCVQCYEEFPLNQGHVVSDYKTHGCDEMLCNACYEEKKYDEFYEDSL
tara:strand:+ start:229 stop:390 length:162 start_codon:yes stop_codon:yes gene_type:complete